MKVRITRKFAEFINGVDLTRLHVGDIVDLPRHDAELLLAEEWATPFEGQYMNATANDLARATKRKSRTE